MLIKIDAFDHDAPMTPALWERVVHFNLFEDWGDPYKMRVWLLYYLDAFRAYIDPHKLVVHCGWEIRDKGWHPAGAAVDLHCPTIKYDELAYLAMQFPFTGIGLYPYWNSPGLHLDVRPLLLDSRRRVWWLDYGKYRNINNIHDFIAV